MATAGEQYVPTGFCGKRYKHKNIGTVGNDVFYWVGPEAI
jgi:hypothetical protein